MTHPTEAECAPKGDRYENKAIRSKCGDEESSVTPNNDNPIKTQQKYNEFIDLLVVAVIFLLFGQLASVILDKLSLFSYFGVRGSVQAVLFIFIAIILNAKYPLDLRHYDRRVLFQYAFIGIGLCFIRYIPFFISLINNPRITENYSIYVNMTGIHYLWSLVILIIIGPFTEELIFRQCLPVWSVHSSLRI